MMFNQRKTDPFFSALLAIAENVQEAVHYADDFKVSSVADLKEVSIKLKNYETEGDKLIHELISKLNKSFMTPIEREDILQLANKMDDVLDGIENFAAHLEMFSLVEIDEYIQKFMEHIVNSTDEIVKAMHLLARKKLEAMRDHAVLIKEYERICDEVFRVSVKQLFIREKDPIRIIQLKDIYEQLEDIADYCQDVANTNRNNHYAKRVRRRPMDTILFLTIMVVVFALAFDFINGFHDTANAIATSVSTRALKPRTAVFMAAIMNFIGALTFTGVAKTISKDIVDPFVLDNGSLVILAALTAAIAWNLITWYYGIPSSSSHALIGSIAGAAISAAGFGILNYTGFLKILQALLITAVYRSSGRFPHDDLVQGIVQKQEFI